MKAQQIIIVRYRDVTVSARGYNLDQWDRYFARQKLIMLCEERYPDNPDRPKKARLRSS